MPITHQNHVLHVDDIAVPALAAQTGTPVYVYSWTDMAARFREIADSLNAIPHRIHYAVKANSNIALLKRLGELGAGFDIVSGGELERVLTAQQDPAQIVFSGVGKSTEELSFALKARVGCIHVESAGELERIASISSRLGIVAPLALRLNPHIEVETHPYIATALHSSKFGIPAAQVAQLTQSYSAHKFINFIGLSVHLGSQIFEIEPYEAAVLQLLDLAGEIRRQGHPITTLNIGGGFGVPYRDESSFDFTALARMLQTHLHATDFRVALEPGRTIVAEAGILVARVEYLKPAVAADGRNFAIVDAAMTELLRPALYDAYHRIETVIEHAETTQRWDVVGPVCETGDFLGLDHPLALTEGELIAVRTAGAYGFAQSSNYNSRPRPAELLVEGDQCHVIRHRESPRDLFRHERLE